MTEDDITEINRAIELQGYIVIGTSTSYAIGDDIKNWNGWTMHVFDQPLKVIAVTTVEEFIQQGVLVRGIPSAPGSWDKFYRCITD